VNGNGNGKPVVRVVGGSSAAADADQQAVRLAEEVASWRFKFDILGAISGVTDDAKFMSAELYKKVFLYPDSAQKYIDALAKKFNNASKHPDIVVGYGFGGGTLAFLLARAFQGSGAESNTVAALAFDELGTENPQDGLPPVDAKMILRGKHILFVTPLLYPSIWPQIEKCLRVLDDTWNVSTAPVIAAIAECGNKPPEMLWDCAVISLAHIS
jgi:hypothetical protein